MEIIVKSIVEVMGKPKAHIEETLKQYIEKLKGEKNLSVRSEDYSEAKERDDGLFSTFVELELACKDLASVVWFCFDYRPASVEIVDPEEIVMNMQITNDYLNDVLGKLHNIDLLLTNLAGENKVLKDNGINVTKNFLTHLIANDVTDLDKIGKITGIPKDMLEKFLKTLEREGKIKKGGNSYVTA